MKTIKDILKSDNIEQRRRIAKTLAISKEDKNALIVNESNGGGGNSSDIEYYRVIRPTDKQVAYLLSMVLLVTSAFINCNQINNIQWIGPGTVATQMDGAHNYNILAIGFINKKAISIYDEEITILEGTLQERADFFLGSLGAPNINMFDYLEPITEEEFYNIKPE